ncbi:ATP-grasp domain-containing protein [Actibacterium lipolyticum]|uniref:Carbamoyl phosphate synthase-like protein n=1 Tax=Actibacterium lipolyticum TaxID=1524263 RepID=A0A238KS76_9RHOB|nr:ATP-grasp domain-containing protein [Actibacterium lipolyticum]SMX45510.1 carbamoyl phosphate synthase-like protein [Actibacterium lipolyticum]
MRVILFGTQSHILAAVAECLDAIGAQYSIVSTRRAGDLAQVTNCQDFVGIGLNDFLNPTQVLADNIQNYALTCRADVLIPVDMAALNAFAVMRGALPQCRIFPISRADTLDLMHNKWRFFNLCRAANIPTPNTWLIETMDQAANVQTQYPVMIKPLAIGGGIGVQSVADAGTLYDRLSAWPPSQYPMLMQEFIPGEDIDVSVLANRGKVIAWTVQKWNGEAELEFLDHPAAVQLAAKLVAKSDFSGVAHFDMRVDERDGTLNLIECNPRFWATVSASLQAGVNFAALGARVAMGLPYRAKPAKPCTVAVSGPMTGAFQDSAKVGARGLIVN